MITLFGKRIYSLLYVVFLLILLYAIQDFKSSRNTFGKFGENRIGVYLSLCSILIVLGIYYIGTKVRRKFFDPVDTILWLITGWIAIVNIIQNVNIWSMAVHLGLSVLWIEIYYFFSHYLQYYPDAWKQIKRCIILIFCFYVYTAIYAARYLAINRGIDDDVISVINIVYSVLVFLPWIALQDKIFRILSLGMTMIAVFVSMKRGAIIAFPLMLIAGIVVETTIQKKKRIQSLKVIFLVVLFYIGLFAANQWSQGFLSERFSKEQLKSGSNRSERYSLTLDEVLKRSFLDLLFGGGSGSSVELFRTGVHNEWLEFLLSFGVIGVMFYALLIFTLIRRGIQLVKYASPYASSYIMAIVYLLVVGMVSGIYFMHSTLFIMAFLGAIKGLTLRNVIKENHVCQP